MKKIILSAIVLTIAAGIQAQEIPERKGERPHMQEGRNHHMQKGRKQHGQHAKAKPYRRPESKIQNTAGNLP